VKLKDWEPDHRALVKIEEEVADFRKQFKILVDNKKPAPQSNLSRCQEKLLALLCKAIEFIIIPTDKNLGPAIMEQSQYLQCCFKDHLRQDQTDNQLYKPEPKSLHYNAQAHIMLAIAESNLDKKCRKPTSIPLLPKAEVDYFH
jgi:hypothetical protein